MKGDNYLITSQHPTEWKSFRRWHKSACKRDPLTSEERFVKEGGVIPEKNVSRSNTRTKKAK